MKTNIDITIRLILVLMLALMLMSGPFSLDINAVILPLMITSLVKIRLHFTDVCDKKTVCVYVCLFPIELLYCIVNRTTLKKNFTHKKKIGKLIICLKIKAISYFPRVILFYVFKRGFFSVFTHTETTYGNYSGVSF